ncbi:MAG: pilin [Halioglobus sp.]
MNIQKNEQQGFTLIELMIVIAIVGILAAIALPAYQDYVIRSKMAEPMASLAEAKTTVSEYYATNNTMPTSGAQAGLTEGQNKDIVKSIIYETATLGLITAIVQDSIIPGALTSPGFSLSAITRSDGSIIWTCGPVTAATGAEVPIKYLPASCRG